MGEPGEDIAEEAGEGEREEPGPNNLPDQAPLHSAEALDRANTHDGRRDHVSGGKRNPVGARRLDGP